MARSLALLLLAAPAVAFMPVAHRARQSTVRMAMADSFFGKIVGGFMLGSVVLNGLDTPIVNAKAGTSPKQQIFGFGADTASNPFVSDTPTYSPYSPYGTGESAVYKPLNAEEIKRYKGVIAESQKRVSKIEKYLAKNQWEEIRSELTRQLYSLRKATNAVAEVSSPAAKEAAAALYQDLNDLSVYAKRKQGAEAQATYASLKANFDALLKSI